MAPRTGPRGVTIEDVQEVADNGRAGYTITRRGAQPAVVVPSASDLAGVLAGGAQPGYGEKYGGFPTASQLNAAVTGNVYQLGALQNALASRAVAAQQPIEQRLAATENVVSQPSMYGRMMTRGERTAREELQTLQNQDKLAALQEMIRNSQPKPTDWRAPLLAGSSVVGIAGAPFTGGASLMFPLAVGATIAGGEATERAMPGRPSWIDDTVSRAGGNILNLTRQAKEQALQTQIQTEQDRAAAARTAAMNRQAEFGQNRYEAEMADIAPTIQLAENAAAISPSQYAQLVATQQYGINPAVAAGMFGLDYNTKLLAQRQAAQQAMLPDFTQNTRELVYNQGGPEALAEYDAQQYAAAMGGTLGQQMSQEETMQELQDAADDNAIYEATQLTPGMVYSNREMADGLRSYMLDPAFQQSVVSARDNALALFQEGEDPAVVAQQAYQEYYEATGDPVAARYIADIAASFAFGS